MSRSINPILLDKTADIAPRRNFARASASTDSASFPEQLAAAAGATNAPQATTQRTEAVLETEGTTNIKPASSWRVNRSAAEVSYEDNDFSFDDVLDILNPLQHIPVLSAYYRTETGDDIKPVARVAGDILFGAVTGSLVISGLASVVTAAYEQQTGEEPVVQVADALFGRNKAEPATMLAEATESTAPVENDTIQLAGASIPPTPENTPPAASAPVQVATLEAPAATKVADAASTAPTVSKQPFGGVMDTTAAARNQRLAAAATLPAQPKGLRVGNTIYTNPAMNNAARLAAFDAAKVAAGKKTAEAMASSTGAASTSAAQPTAVAAAVTPSSSSESGQPTQQSAAISGTGRPLPPELVRDMMLMALDKYKTAGTLSSGSMSLPAVN